MGSFLSAELWFLLNGIDDNYTGMHVDTKGTHRPERLLPMAERQSVFSYEKELSKNNFRDTLFRFNMDIEWKHVLENIAVARCYNSDEKVAQLTYAAAIMVQSRYALLTADGAIGVFR
ncbi:hypothetical protein GCK32_011758 [Trichostrongylus colubriformis]|uniref:Rad51-like C-terminal domain-containing protein n=1 Tax=Trichostrongylus colubriformis TaxID=6319 RepID=A0AAN8FLJ4_TRICO